MSKDKDSHKRRESKKEKKIKIGGMATFNGVLLKSDKRQVVTSKLGNNIMQDITETKSNKLISILPILRGIAALYFSIVSGIPYIVESAKEIINNIVKDKNEKISINTLEIIVSFILSFIIFSLVWINLPMIASLIIPTANLRWIFQVIIKIGIFIIYINTLKRVTYFSELFEYHGAEHTAVNYYENNVKEVNNIKSILDVNIDKVATYSKLHKRCGSNYIMHLLYISLILTALIPSDDIAYKILLELATFPLIIGLAYETLNLSSYIPKKLDFVLIPTLYVQNITTKVPSKDKLLIGVASLLELTNKHISVQGYIKQYMNKYLKKVEVNQNDILRLIAYTLKIDKNTLYLNLESKKLTVAEQINIKNVLDRYYIKHEPLQYILGVESFYKEEYIVNKNVLVPRADTEVLVETAIKYINEHNFESAIDMCTGSGAIGISVSKNSNIEKMVLADVSQKALDVADRNIIKNSVVDKCTTIKSDLFTVFIENGVKFDIILTNPPYIKSEEIPNLSKYVQKEPLLALNGGKTGLDVYERIFKEAKEVLNDNGYIILEIGYDQKQDIIDIISEYEEYEYIECKKDLGLKDRVIVCHFHQI